MTVTMILPPFISTDDLGALMGQPSRQRRPHHRHRPGLGLHGRPLVPPAGGELPGRCDRGTGRARPGHAPAAGAPHPFGRLRHGRRRGAGGDRLEPAREPPAPHRRRGLHAGHRQRRRRLLPRLGRHRPVTLPVPADIRLVALISARRVYSAVGATDAAGTQASETMGSYSYTTGSTAQVASTAAQLLPAEQAAIHWYRVGLIP